MQLLTIAEAAERLKVSTRTIRRYISDGILPASRLSRKTIRIKESDVVALLGGAECQDN